MTNVKSMWILSVARKWIIYKTAFCRACGGGEHKKIFFLNIKNFCHRIDVDLFTGVKYQEINIQIAIKLCMKLHGQSRELRTNHE